MNGRCTMQKSWKISIVISSIMLIGIIISSIIVYNSYSRVITDNTKSIAELSATNIYSEINNELTKPIYVSLTMASDTFVKDWLFNEDIASISEITAYLEGVKEKYYYSSVFLVSTDSLSYFHFDGIHKTISPTDSVYATIFILCFDNIFLATAPAATLHAVSLPDERPPPL